LIGHREAMPDTPQLNLNSLPINFGYAWLAAWAAHRLSAVQRTLRGLDRAAGAMFIGFGLKLTMSDNPTP
jgi:threonine/homoserine/homoserine lactone efflux protein